MITDEAACRPFDRRRKGLNLGEGAAILVLESEKLSGRWIHPPLAMLVGYGSASDAYHLTAPDPQGRGLRRAILAAMEESGMQANDLAFINAHGTGTLDNDAVESRVLSELLPGVPFYSSKGFTGHTLGAAGAIEAAFTIASLNTGIIPPSAGYEEHDFDLPAHPVKKETAVVGRAALSQSLAFGGGNAVLIFGKE
jgi:3-oxoacyl-[acyl-carrier-protein] synthase-1/3-oxoacyl-[acyl-carrier-protein] synthase II